MSRQTYSQKNQALSKEIAPIYLPSSKVDFHSDQLAKYHIDIACKPLDSYRIFVSGYQLLGSKLIFAQMILVPKPMVIMVV